MFLKTIFRMDVRTEQIAEGVRSHGLGNAGIRNDVTLWAGSPNPVFWSRHQPRAANMRLKQIRKSFPDPVA